MNTKQILIGIWLASQCAVTAFAASLAPGDRLALESSISKANIAAKQRDADAIADLTFAPLVDKLGGRAEFVASLKASFQFLDALKHKLHSHRSESPEEAMEVGDYLVGIVKEKTHFEIAGGQWRTNGFTLAVRKKSDVAWSLIGGDGIHKNPELLPELIPGWSGNFQLPEYATEQIEAKAGAPGGGKPAVAVVKRLPAEVLAGLISSQMTFPVQVDEETRLDSVQGKGDTLSYNYTALVTLDKDEVKVFPRIMKDVMKRRACGSENYLTLLKQGYRIEFNFAVEGLPKGVRIVVKPADCGL